MKTKHTIDRNAIKRNYRKLLKQANPNLIEQATTWYLDAQRIAEQVANNLDTTLEVGAAIVAAFSPRERWTINISKALAYSLGLTVRGLQVNYDAAERCKRQGIAGLNGPKTIAFAKAISGDTTAVVIDIWMMRGAGITKDSPTAKQYWIIADCVNELAFAIGLTPRTTQVLIWLIARNKG